VFNCQPMKKKQMQQRMTYIKREFLLLQTSPIVISKKKSYHDALEFDLKIINNYDRNFDKSFIRIISSYIKTEQYETGARYLFHLKTSFNQETLAKNGEILNSLQNDNPKFKAAFVKVVEEMAKQYTGGDGMSKWKILGTLVVILILGSSWFYGSRGNNNIPPEAMMNPHNMTRNNHRDRDLERDRRRGRDPRGPRGPRGPQGQYGPQGPHNQYGPRMPPRGRSRHPEDIDDYDYDNYFDSPSSFDEENQGLKIKRIDTKEGEQQLIENDEGQARAVHYEDVREMHERIHENLFKDAEQNIHNEANKDEI